jgi:hypothetical protein
MRFGLSGGIGGNFFLARRNMMLRGMVTLLAVLAFAGFQAPVQAGGCKGCNKVSKSGSGFCCGKGAAFGVKLASQKLQAALAGHRVDLEKHPCAGCRTAGKTDGKCAGCKTYAADGMVYHSPVSHALAKGKLVTDEMMASCPKKCTECKTAHGENGRCKACNVGFVAGRKFDNEKEHAAALAAYKTLEKAASTAGSCEACAVAMVTDGACARCKVNFRDGKVASSKG